VTPRPASSADAIAAIRALDDAIPDRTVWVGVDGFGAAGKSSLAAAISAALGRVSVVHVDDFSGPRVREWDWERFAAQVARPLLGGRAARYQAWDWDRDAGGEWVDVRPGRLVVIEGVSSTRRDVGAPWDLTIWVEAPRDVRLARALERDGAELMPRWLEDWMPSEEAYAARERPQERVDLIVDGTG
jgi:uridine kinase